MPAEPPEMDQERRQLGHENGQERLPVLQGERAALEALRIHGRKQDYRHYLDGHARSISKQTGTVPAMPSNLAPSRETRRRRLCGASRFVADQVQAAADDQRGAEQG